MTERREGGFSEVGQHEDVDHEFLGTVLILSPEWRLVDTEKHCRRQLGRNNYCRRYAVIELNRAHSGQRAQWWAYCERHTYGRIPLEDGIYFVRSLHSHDVELSEVTA